MLKLNPSKIKQSRYYILIVVISFLLYGNSINNEYSLDDNIVVEGVEKVNKGLKGIPEIFTTHLAIDKKQSYQYRPLVSLTFALEKQLFKGLPEKQTLEEKKRKDKLTQANISHFVNVLLYALTGIVLFNFLLLLFKENNVLLPLLVTILFIVHPLHTEPVANIKSRDELLMFLGMILALIQYLKYAFSSKYKYLGYASLFVFLAMMAKESTLALIGMVPVILFFLKMDVKKILISTATVICIGGVFIFMKQGLLTSESVRNMKYFENPLFFEHSFMDRITMGLYSSWFYLLMLIFPKDMSYYYGYAHIPFANWSHYQVWLAMLVYIPLGVYGVLRFLKRDVLGLGIVLWLGVMLGFINVLFPIVGIVADRFAYVFSLGFCIVIGVILLRIFKIDNKKETFQIKLPNGFVFTILAIMVLYSGRVIARNPAWHDYLTTYYKDVEIVEESAKAHAMIANTLYAYAAKNRQDPNHASQVNEIIKHYTRAIEIDSTYLTCYSNVGSAYIDMKQDYQSGIYYCSKAVQMNKDYLEANLNLAIAYDRTNMPDSALKYYYRVIEISPDFTGVFNSLNNLLSRHNLVNRGIEDLKKMAGTASYPKNIYLNIANLLSMDESNIEQYIVYFEKAYALDNTDKVLCNHIASLYLKKGDQQKANDYSQRCNL